MCKTWPFMDDLLKHAEMPHDLADVLRQRYDEHAEEYATDATMRMRDGVDVPINACMTNDTRQDIEDEVVDAIFNALVLLHKHEDPEHYEDGRVILQMLRGTWLYLRHLMQKEEIPA